MKKIIINKKEKIGNKHSIEATIDEKKVKLFFQKEREELTDEKIKKIIERLK